MFLNWDRIALRQRGIILQDEEAEARHMVAAGEGNPYILGLYRDLLDHGSESAKATAVAQLAAMEAQIRRSAAIPARRIAVT